MNIMIYQDPGSMWAEDHRRCDECALIAECPMWAKGKFSDLRSSKETPGFCTYWRPVGTGEGYCPPATCEGCRWNEDGLCHRLTQVSSDAGWPMRVRVHDGNSACNGFQDRPEPWEMSVVTGGRLEDPAPKRQTSAVLPDSLPDTAHLAALTAEVNVLASQMAQHALQIGRKLKEIKELLPHGEFEAYVEEHCGFKQRLARQFMRIAAEYTVETLPSGLSVSKVYELLALPADQREAFVASHDVESATVRQLREEIRQAKQQAETAAQDRETLQVQLDAAREQLDYSDEQLKEAEENLTRQTAVTLDLGDKLRSSQCERSQLAQQLNDAQAALESRPKETITVEVTREVPPADYEAYRQEATEMRERLRVLERPTADLESLMHDVLDRWDALVEKIEAVQIQTGRVLNRSRDRAKVDPERCAWLSSVVSVWEGYVTEMHAHFTRLFAEAVGDVE